MTDSTPTKKPGPAPTVFYPALLILTAIVAVSIFFPDGTARAIEVLNDNVVGKLGWYYTLAVTGFVAFVIWMAVGRFGDIKLAPDDEEEPQYGFMSWFAMLFAAGMGIGLVFWGG